MIETPEEFAQLFDPCARGEFIGIEEAARIIATRDAALTAKVREECADRAPCCPRLPKWRREDERA